MASEKGRGENGIKHTNWKVNSLIKKKGGGHSAADPSSPPQSSSRSPPLSPPGSVMSFSSEEGPAELKDPRIVFQNLHSVLDENIAFFRGQGSSEPACRFVAVFSLIQSHARSLEPAIHAFTSVYHVFDFDAATPANGYRSLVKVVLSCLLHIVHKGRYVSSSRRSLFFRASHNVTELESYCSALCQLRALVYFAQRLLTANRHGDLFFLEERGLSEEFVRQYASMHKGCFYERCMGFQFTPAIRPFLQTISIGLVSFGENYKRHQSGIGVAASSFFTSGKYAMDPELRGFEFERITQNLDVNFWKAFWNITEMEVLASLANITSTTVRVNKTLSVPPHSFELPLAADPRLHVTITPPVAHCGPAPVNMRLLSYELKEGQDSEELTSLVKQDGSSLNIDLRLKPRRGPPSKYLLVHFHGGGFVAQTSKSHEPYLKSWARELDTPILSIDYSLAPEAPFPRALEECFFAYCWALKNCHLLGSTAERVCLAGDSAGGNLCLTVSMRAASYGVRLPDGIMTAYPATLLTATASPSRLLTLIDPLLPLSVLSKCLSAYAGTEPMPQKRAEKVNTMSLVRKDTALLLRDFRLGASAWISSLLDNGRGGKNRGTDTVRKSVSEAALNAPQSDPVPLDSGVPGTSFSKKRDSLKSQTCQDLGSHTPFGTSPPGQQGALQSQDSRQQQPEDVSFFLTEDSEEGHPDSQLPLVVVPEVEEEPGFVLGPPRCPSPSSSAPQEFPEGFEPLRSDQLADMKLQTSPIVQNPFMSPLLAPDDMLRGLPPLHIVACALDPMLDDSVMFAKRLRAVGQQVSLCVVEDLPHGFLSLSQLSRETKDAANICVQRIREVFHCEAPPRTQRKHRKLERTNHGAGGVAGAEPGEEPGTVTSQPSVEIGA
ncbi:hormone-sensitive lipase [Acipenser oxyrinchus oxyrinchus]|uniref:Hormone-sensitive lipase n=1 Tax=Acipenser oxyrinchus oxyrinchus TaxID=40147 RepID=A0AAD8CJE0_ACIOX|nr:hormone-sensitive lipase [Acipenser oxyrinchus oxyrinchus]